MDIVTFHFQMGMACMEWLETRFMDVVTTYLNESLDSDMKNAKGLKLEETKPRHLY